MIQLSSIYLYTLIILFVIYRQLQPKRIKASQKQLLILVLIGLFFVLQSIDDHELVLSPVTIAGTLVSLLILAIGFGVLRAMSCQIWYKDGVAYRKATWLTILLWFLMIFLHGAIDYLTKSGSATMFLYLALTIFTQRLVLQARSKKLTTTVSHETPDK